MDLSFLSIVSLATVISAVLGGLGLGFYLAGVNGNRRFIPNSVNSFMTMLVIGASFMLPLMTARLTEGSPTAQHWLGVFLLWVIFAASTVTGNILSTSRGRRD